VKRLKYTYIATLYADGLIGEVPAPGYTRTGELSKRAEVEYKSDELLNVREIAEDLYTKANELQPVNVLMVKSKQLEWDFYIDKQMVQVVLKPELVFDKKIAQQLGESSVEQMNVLLRTGKPVEPQERDFSAPEPPSEEQATASIREDVERSRELYRLMEESRRADKFRQALREAGVDVPPTELEKWMYGDDKS